MSINKTFPEPGEKNDPRPDSAKQGSTPRGSQTPDSEGSNAVEHAPDPDAKPIPGVDRKYIPGSGFVHGND